MRISRVSSSFCSMSRRLMSRKETTKTTLLPWRLCDQSSLLFSKTTYVQNFNVNPLIQAHFSSPRYHETGNRTLAKVEIISNEFIKPAISTPQHLRTYEVSVLDQVFPNVYMSLVYFFQNNHQNDDELILERRQILKQSLSKTLTKFYPLAGRINKDNRSIDCNDNGVFYVEAKMDDHLSDFLKHPPNKSIHRLLPLDPNSKELFSRKDLVMIQMTVFGCGSISIGLYTGHKIMDGSSIATFLKSWSATARSSSEEINPSFVLPSIVPSNPALPQDVSGAFFPVFSKNKNATRRFLFRASSLATLKQKADSSRVVAVMGLIWKCAIAASRARSTTTTSNTTPKSWTLSQVVNLRGRILPPLSPHSIGNFFCLTTPIQCGGNDDLLGLGPIAQSLENATSIFSSHEFIKKVIETWSYHPEAAMDRLRTWYEDKNAKHMIASSICRSGAYETDFGWGSPLWVCVGNGDSNSQFTENFVLLIDTRCGKGIEAWVTLDEEDMMIFERDPELLGFASLDANPLELDA